MALKRYILNEASIDSVFDLDEEVFVNSTYEAAKPVTEVLASELDEYDITDKTAEFKKGLTDTWQDLSQSANPGYPSSIDIQEYTDNFITDVLGLNLFGPEYLNELDDYSIEVYIKDINYTTPVLPPDKFETNHYKKNYKHIIHGTMPATYFEAWKAQYIKSFIYYFVNSFLAEHISADAIIDSLDHLGVLEHLDPADDLRKDIRKAFTDLKYATGHKMFKEANEIKKRIAKVLDGIEGEMKGRAEASWQTIITKGRGATQALWDILERSDMIDIDSFKITGDF